MTQVKRVAIALVCAVLFLSCGYGGEDLFGRDGEAGARAASLGEMPPPFSVVPSLYTVAIISDVHFGRDSRSGECHEKAIRRFDRWLDALDKGKRPLFVVCLGDVTEHGEESEVKEYAAWVARLESIQNSIGNIKVYNAVGNHDLYNGGLDTWKRLVCPQTFYCMTTTLGDEKLSWYFIDSASGSLGRKQYNALADALVQDKNHKVVLSHFPLFASGTFYFCMQNTSERNLLISMFAKSNVLYVFTGHTHKEHVDNFDRFIEYNVPSLLDKGKWLLVTVSDNNKIETEITAGDSGEK